jgi:16S rRNA C1402 (ribose-2'-O) methylase RsmI
MIYITLDYLKEIIPKEHYENILKNFNGCLIYVSKNKHENKEDGKMFRKLIEDGLSPADAVKKIARMNEKSERSIYYKLQKGLFDDE